MVLNDNSPKYVEEFYSENSDVFNSYNGGKDPKPSDDYWPAFARASVSHLSLDPSKRLRKQRTYGFPILLGKTQDVYRLSRPLPAFASFIGLYAHVQLKFYDDTNGVFVHYPDAGRSVGTLHGGPEILPTELGDWEGYGAYRIVLKNIAIIGTHAEGTRGLVIHRACTVEDCWIQNFGWHGVHITADSKRNPGASNANGSFIQGLHVERCGWNPGEEHKAGGDYDQRPWNPNRLRPFGSGLRIEGGDANVIKVIGYSGRFNAYAAIHDSGFLGNHHIMPHCVVGTDGLRQGGFELKADYRTICDDVANYVKEHRSSSKGDPLYKKAEHDQREFCYYDANIGDRVKVAYVINNPAAYTKLETPYVEVTEPPSIIHVEKPSMVSMGTGGRLWEGTTRQDAIGFHGSVRVGPLEGTNNSPPPSITYGLAPGVLSQMRTGSQRQSGRKGEYRFKYVNFNNDDPSSPGPHDQHAGWYRLDSRGANKFVTLLMTAFESQLAGRTHDEGRICIPQEVLLGRTARRLILGNQPTPQQAKLDPTNPDHNLQEADLYLYTGKSLAPGQGLLWVVVNNGGTLEWEQRL